MLMKTVFIKRLYLDCSTRCSAHYGIMRTLATCCFPSNRAFNLHFGLTCCSHRKHVQRLQYIHAKQTRKFNAGSFLSMPYDTRSDKELEDLLKDINSDFDKQSPSDHTSSKANNNDSKNGKDTTTSKANIDNKDEQGNNTNSTSAQQRQSSSHEQHLEVEDFTESALPTTELASDEEVIYEYIEEEKLPKVGFERGRTGVFEVEELVSTLEEENAKDICVIKVPKKMSYVDYMVIVSGVSTRHIKAMAEWVKWVHKKKKEKRDSFLNIEGRDCKDWIALDLGNIALHLFLPDTRETYDLETLWTCGQEFDMQSGEDPYALHIYDEPVNPSLKVENNTADMRKELSMESDVYHQKGFDLTDYGITGTETDRTNRPGNK